MSRFSNKLKVLIEDSGTNVYQLAKKAQLDRTTIQRAIVGERLPSVIFVEKLCDYLRVSPMERKELLEFHAISKVGEDVYASRNYIKGMIERFETIHTKTDNMFVGEKAVVVDIQINKEVNVFSGQYSVNNLIHDILEDAVYNYESSSQIDLIVPFEYTFLYDSLYQLYYRRKGKINIRHIVKLSKNPKTLQNSNTNLKLLSDVLPFAFSTGSGYQPYYYYGNTDVAIDIATIMPYYILTNKRLVTLSADFTTAVLYNNKEITKAYRAEFDKVILQTRPFINQLSDCGEMLSTYLNVYKDAGRFTHTIEPQPCLAKYYTHQMVNEKLRQDVEQRDMLCKLLYHLFDGYKDFPSIPMSLFSIEGLEYFVNTGIMADLPERFALPFTVEERKHLLQSLRDEIEKDSYLVRAIDNSKFSISSVATIQLYGINRLIFITADDHGIISCLIDEKSICEAYYDFFESLPNCDLVYSKEETLKIIDDFIAQIARLEISSNVVKIS
ncbi:MAG TPA: helix-turn-helix transcriptional regulator [Desulfosporosinus sp.]|nr:helix-turn-helix transcriptional regulator [Desulfosporosinus sp.]